MERRKFMIGAGSTAIGASAIVGSGAFTSMSSGDRDLDANVTADSGAFLQITPSNGPNGAYASENEEGKIQLHFDQDADTFSIGDDRGTGVNPGSEYTFDNVFNITNRGTQEVDVWITKSDLPGVYFYFNGDPDKSILFHDWDGLFDRPESFNPSEAPLEIGVRIIEDELGVEDLGSLSGSIQVHAEASPDSEVRE